MALSGVQEGLPSRVRRRDALVPSGAHVRERAGLDENDDRPRMAVPAGRAAGRDRDLLDDDLTGAWRIRDDRAAVADDLELDVDVIDEVGAGKDRRRENARTRRPQGRTGKRKDDHRP